MADVGAIIHLQDLDVPNGPEPAARNPPDAPLASSAPRNPFLDNNVATPNGAVTVVSTFSPTESQPSLQATAGPASDAQPIAAVPPSDRPTYRLKKSGGGTRSKAKKRSVSPGAQRVGPAESTPGSATPPLASKTPPEKPKLQAPRWVPDDDVTACKQCGLPFNALLLRFKHHCRACGDIFCGSCTKFCSLPLFEIHEEVRVCGACFDKEAIRKEKEAKSSAKREQRRLDDERLQRLFSELHAAFEKSDEGLALTLKTEIDLLKEAIYRREERRQKKKAEKLKRKEEKKEEKRLAKVQHQRAKQAATAPAALISPPTLGQEGTHEAAATAAQVPATAPPSTKPKKKKPEPKNDLAVRVVDGEPDNEESIRLKLEQKLQVPFTKLLSPPSGTKCCLVLDIDYTLFDHRWYTQVKDELRKQKSLMPEFQRPYLHQFLTTVSENFDLVIWSATGMNAIDSKMTNLGIYSSPDYRITLVLSKENMISVKRRKKNGVVVEETVKPLEVIWSKFPQYTPQNTVHIDDMANNFRLNPRNGICITPYKDAPKHKGDTELMYLTKYLLLIASTEKDFSALNHTKWKEYIISKLWEKQTEFVIPQHIPEAPNTAVLADDIAAQVERSLRKQTKSGSTSPSGVLSPQSQSPSSMSPLSSSPVSTSPISISPRVDGNSPPRAFNPFLVPETPAPAEPTAQPPPPNPVAQLSTAQAILDGFLTVQGQEQWCEASLAPNSKAGEGSVSSQTQAQRQVPSCNLHCPRGKKLPFRLEIFT